MEHACGKHRIGLAIDDAFCEMLELANAAARDNGNAYRPGNCASERYIETGLGTIAIHAREQNLARSALSGLRRPFNLSLIHIYRRHFRRHEMRAR